jgi:hypothetical protein
MMELGWCIEKWVGASLHYVTVGALPTDPNCKDCFVWTPDNLQALRMSRREDAEQLFRYIQHMTDKFSDGARVAEHSWVAG